MKEMKMSVSADIGNHKTALIINNTDVIIQPSTYAMGRPPRIENQQPEQFIPALLDELSVSVESQSVTNSGYYIIGKRSLNMSNTRNVRLDIPKHKQDLPIIIVNSMIAAKAVQIAFEEDKAIPEAITVTVDMVTALPILPNDSSAAISFANRFMENDHTVSVFVGKEVVVVKVKFDFVHVMSESGVAVYELILDEKKEYKNDDIFSELKTHYEIKSFTGEDVLNTSMVMCLDIGGGTTDVSVTRGYKLLTDLIDGRKLGIDYAISEAIHLFEAEYDFRGLNRQKYAAIVKDQTHSFHQEALAILMGQLEDQAIQIREFVDYMLVEKTDRQSKLLVVHGGGSVLLRSKLYEDLLEMTKKTKAKLLWVSDKYAETLNVRGLNVFMNTLYTQVKEELQKVRVK